MFFYRIFYMAYMTWAAVTVRTHVEIETGCYFDADRPHSAFCIYDLREDGDFLAKP